MKKKEKIIFIINRLGGPGWGGAHRVAVILANYFASNDYDVELFSWNCDQIDYPINNSVKITNFNIECKNFKDRIKVIYLMRKQLKKRKKSYIYVLMSRLTIDVFFANIFLKHKIIGSERTDPNTEPKNKLARVLRNIVFCLIYKCVFQTNDAQNYFPKMARNKSVVIPNPLTDNLPERFIGKRKHEFVTFCRIDKQKNLPMMIDAFILFHEKYNDFILNIYGDGLIRSEIENYIIEKNAELYIILNHFEKKIHDKIIDSFAYLNSSDYEGMSNSMLEALAIGLPCICTDCKIGGAKMIIKDHYNGILVETGNSMQLYLAMCELVENDNLREKISLNSIKIKEELCQDVICRKWEKLMNNEG